MAESKEPKRIYTVEQNEIELCLRSLFAESMAAFQRHMSAGQCDQKYLRSFNVIMEAALDKHFAPRMAVGMTQWINHALAQAAAMHQGEPAPLSAPAAAAPPIANLNITLSIAESPRISKIAKYDDKGRIAEMISEPIEAISQQPGA